MPAFATDKDALSDLAEALRAIANLVARWPANAPGEAHIQITHLSDSFRKIHKDLDEAAEKGHDLTNALAPMATNLRSAADALEGRSEGRSHSR